MLVLLKNFCFKTARKPSNYKALSHFCVIITRASTRRTIPVAFIYIYLLILQITLLVSVNAGDLYLKGILHHAIIFTVIKIQQKEGIVK